MILDCYDFYLWTSGELKLSEDETKDVLAYIENQNQDFGDGK